MTQNAEENVFISLVSLASRQGYITYDNILDIAERRDLPINEIDRLTNTLIKHGILILERKPDENDTIKGDDDYDDFAQTDYRSIFKHILRKDRTLSTFINSVRVIKPPQSGELSRLIYQAKEGNKYARKRIIEMYIRIAVRLGFQKALQYDVAIDDCIEDALTGLIVAIDQFNPDTGTSFLGGATFRILSSVLKKIPTKRSQVRYPAKHKEQFLKAYSVLKNEGCFECNKILNCTRIRERLSTDSGIETISVEYIIAQAVPFESLESFNSYSLSNESDNECELAYINEDDNPVKYTHEHTDSNCLVLNDDPLIQLVTQERVRLVRNILEILNHRERKIISLRYGISGKHEYTFEEIGSIFKISRERVRQIINGILLKLRHHLELNEVYAEDYW